MLSGMKKRNILIGKSMGIFEKGDNFNRNKNKSSAPKPHKQVKPYVSVSNAPHRETVNYKLMRIVAERKGSLDAAIALEMLAGDHSEKSIRFGLYALGKGGYLIHEKRGAPYNASEKARIVLGTAILFNSKTWVVKVLLFVKIVDLAEFMVFIPKFSKYSKISSALV